MAQYYTLEEAARILQTTPDAVRKMADDKKLRTFRDKGTLRFRSEEIHELARQMGLGSDADLQLGEVPSPKKGASPLPTTGRKSSKVSKVSKLDKPKEPAPKDDVFEFNLSLDEEEEQVQLGALPPPSIAGSKSGRRSKLGPASTPPKPKSKPPTPKSKLGSSTPAPKPGSDSDVRLVGDVGDFDFTIPMQEDAPSRPPSPPSPPPKPGHASKKQSRVSKLASPDSGVRIVPLEPSDSDIKMFMDPGDDVVALGGGKPSSASDSDIRLEQLPREGNKGNKPEMVTEEIDLDAEMSRLSNSTPAPRPKPSAPQLPTSSPFELSEEDLGMDDEDSAGMGSKERPVTDSSGDFELTPDGDDLSPLELGSDEMPALNIDDSDEVSLGELSNAGGGGSGINLRDPADSGISLEQEGSDEINFDSLDSGGTPPPSSVDDSDSEFELSLDDDSSETESAPESSEFELSLDDSGSSELELDLEPVGEDAAQDSDSEFELTLDDSGGGSPLDEESEDKDIFETDFEVPALEEESGSEAVALDEDTDLETSDFDLAIDEMDVDSEEESGSQVVALEDDDELLDEDDAPKPKRKTKLLQAEDDEDASEFAGIGPVLGDDDDEEETEVAVVGAGGKGRVQYVEKEPAPWGPVPVILMLPCIIVLFVVGLMGFELVTGMMSYQRTGKFSGLLITPITEAITGEKMPGSKK